MSKYRNIELNAFTIIEVLVAVAIIGIVFASLLGVAAFSLNATRLAKETVEANALGQEVMEAVRNFRDNIAWGNDDGANQYDGLGVVPIGAPHHPALSTDNPPRWMLIAGAETLGAFTRQAVFDAVQRDATTKNIVSSGGTVDTGTKKVTVTVSWPFRGVIKTVTLVTYLTNWR